MVSGASRQSPVEYGEMLLPPFFGTSEALRWKAQTLLDAVESRRAPEQALGETGAAPLEIDNWTSSPWYHRIKEAILKDEVIDARGIYGYFNVYTDREWLYVLDPRDSHSEIASFHFPRDLPGEVSIADYFRPEGDLLTVWAVTIGRGLLQRTTMLLTGEDNRGDVDGVSGLGARFVADLTRRMSAEIRRGLFLPNNQGRYCLFGNPGFPERCEEIKLIEILGGEDRLNITLSPELRLVPEHSAIGIFVHHYKEGSSVNP
jgi:cobalamin-dependent methionine synthase I